MRALILLVVLAAGLLVVYPLVGEDTSSSCNALERVTVRLVTSRDRAHPAGDLLFAQLLQGLSGGQFAAIAAKDHYPSLPPGLACTVLYWRAVLDSDNFVKEIVKPH